MANSLDALTDKEKATLRLITRGHDAKSMARKLGLSVHTINERLRTARRKLNVTSSREAARLLLEAETPENLGHKGFGGDPIGGHRDASFTRQPVRNRAVWIGGFIAMITFTAAALITLSGVTSLDRQASDPATVMEATQLEEFERAAREWLALVDVGDWQRSYDAAGQSFQEPNTVATWRDASLAARAPLGAVMGRNASTAKYVNAPPHGYVVMRFETQFENRVDAIESVTLEQEGEGWKVVGYVID